MGILIVFYMLLVMLIETFTRTDSGENETNSRRFNTTENRTTRKLFVLVVEFTFYEMGIISLA